MPKVAYKGFKLNKNNQLQCLGMIYELDKEYIIDGNLELCKNGMHFCWELRDVNRYYNFNESTICEVEILGDVVEGDDKACTNKLKVLRIIDKEEVMETTNEGTGNIGYSNKGNDNTGEYNVGDDNTGDWNTGNNNEGDRNKGNGNTGSNNRGNSNIGHYNKGNNTIGSFNTISNIGSLDNIALFNKLSNISMEEFKQMEICDICYWGWSSEHNETLIQSPNFDKDIFEEIFGIKIY